MTERNQALKSKLDSLRPLVKRAATAEFSLQSKFAWCFAASFVKAFEFAEQTSQQDHGNAYFLMPSLRSIAEEIIFLKYISTFSDEEREFVLGHLFELDVIGDVKHQTAFFGTFRPFQPVLFGENKEEKRLRNELWDFWRRKGWRRFKKTTSPIVPPTREIAEKLEEGMMEIVYDFIYRLSSMSVHFHTRGLLRMGWGDKEATATFSPKNMGHYHQELIHVYGTYLFCLYFELFQELIKPDEQEKEAVVELRDHLQRIFRWPEMVTFEEMNLPVPNPQTQKWPNLLIYSLYSVVMKEGFISGAKEILRIKQNSQSGPIIEEAEA